MKLFSKAYCKNKTKKSVSNKKLLIPSHHYIRKSDVFLFFFFFFLGGGGAPNRSRFYENKSTNTTFLKEANYYTMYMGNL